MARAGAILRGTVRTLGELLVTFAVLMALFIVYQLYYTNIVGRQEMSDEVSSMRRAWSVSPGASHRPDLPDPAVAAKAPNSAPPTVPTPKYGSGIAIIHIPRLGAEAVRTGTPVLEGVGLDVLNKATGHYPGSAMPGDIGNFAVAGHRKTHGEPFRHLDEIRAGDLVFVETAGSWFTYRVDGDPVVVPPSDVAVVAAVPGHPGVAPSQRLITLTTCDPWWSSTQRMIVVGRLVDTRPAAAGPLPGLAVP